MTGGRSTIVIPVPEADSLIGGYRLQYDPPARRGMPAHVTLLYPFLAPSDLTETVSRRLAEMFASETAFRFALCRTVEFAQGVLYLEPDPSEPFLALTRRIEAEFGVQPYEGRFVDPQPHCTVAQEADELMRREIEIKLAPALPVESQAREAWLMVRDDRTPWRLLERFILG
jgi:2'-5' RNA ligase